MELKLRRFAKSEKDDETGEMISLVTPEDGNQEDADGDKLPDILPILPVKNTVLFPGGVIPVTVGRQKSIRTVKKAYRGNRIIGVLAQRNGSEEPSGDDLYSVGTVAIIVKMLVLPDGNTTIIIQGKRRFEVKEFTGTEPIITAKVDYLKEQFPVKTKRESKALVASLKDLAAKIMKLNPEIPQEAQIALDNIESPVFLTHFLSSNINAEVEDKQKLLELPDGVQRAHMLLELMQKEIQLLELKNEIQNRVHHEVDQQQRDYFLRQQIKVLQDELGGGDSASLDIERIKIKADKKTWAPNVEAHFLKELDKFSRQNPMSPEYGVSLNYLELLTDLPWNEYTKDVFNLQKAKKVLNSQHFGLEKVKERILEYLAVLELRKDMKAPILCLYGPPGVGKTSLGKSIATALGRKYIRMSLGGLHDEAEVRGHRKTYVGAMPGKIIQNIKKAGASNPVFILDEIDKIGRDFRGDPSSALLEVLDPEQNHSFMDNYLEIEYDLSKVMFIATANELDTIQPALRDRMDIIEINGYTQEEKLQIATKYLVPKQIKEHGLQEQKVKFTKEALDKLIDEYTRESGVRSLERTIGKVYRKIASKVVVGNEIPEAITPIEIESFLGSPIFDKEAYQDNDTAGVVTGLAWTSVGGDILFIESLLSKGNGKLTLSGQLGDVMKESAMAALTYLKANAEKLGIDYKVFRNFDVHIHIPAGAVPKDGPSAGITLFTSLASAFTQRKVKSRLAMTGEITLRGKVLPVGGIKEKILAARRSGIKEIIMCHRNKKDVEEIPANYIKDLKFHYVESADEVLRLALLPEKVKNPIDLSWAGEGFVQNQGAVA